MKCQILFSWKNHNIINLLSAVLAPKAVKVDINAKKYILIYKKLINVIFSKTK